MDKITTTKTQLRLQHWIEIINQCQSSGMTVKSWCKCNNINKDQYYYWLRKVRERTLEQLPAAVNNLPTIPDEPNGTSISFKQLEVKTPAGGMHAAVIVHLPQATIEVASGTDHQTVEAVLLALKSIC